MLELNILDAINIKYQQFQLLYHKLKLIHISVNVRVPLYLSFVDLSTLVDAQAPLVF